MQRGLVTEVEIVDVYDGDTVVVQPMLPTMRIRLLDCWAPEIRTRDDAEKVRGYEARDYLRELLPAGSRVMMEVPTDRKLQGSLTMGRVLGRIYVEGEDGQQTDVAELMVEAGHATKDKE